MRSQYSVKQVSRQGSYHGEIMITTVSPHSVSPHTVSPHTAVYSAGRASSTNTPVSTTIRPTTLHARVRISHVLPAACPAASEEMKQTVGSAHNSERQCKHTNTTNHGHFTLQLRLSSIQHGGRFSSDDTDGLTFLHYHTSLGYLAHSAAQADCGRPPQHGAAEHTPVRISQDQSGSVSTQLHYN